MTTKMTLLSSQPYRIVNEKTGEITEGLTLFFYNKDSFTPAEQERGAFTVKGNKPFKANLPISMESKIKTAPGLYEVEIEMQASADMKAQLRVIDLEFLGELELKLIKKAS